MDRNRTPFAPGDERIESGRQFHSLGCETVFCRFDNRPNGLLDKSDDASESLWLEIVILRLLDQSLKVIASVNPNDRKLLGPAFPKIDQARHKLREACDMLVKSMDAKEYEEEYDDVTSGTDMMRGQIVELDRVLRPILFKLTAEK